MVCVIEIGIVLESFIMIGISCPLTPSHSIFMDGFKILITHGFGPKFGFRYTKVSVVVLQKYTY